MIKKENRRKMKPGNYDEDDKNDGNGILMDVHL